MGGGGTSRFKVGDNPIYMTSTSLGILMNIHNLQQFKKFVHDCVDPYLNSSVNRTTTNMICRENSLLDFLPKAMVG